jgi:adenosylmethionine-8-amino-7-oxononanoate aminotransferase
MSVGVNRSVVGDPGGGGCSFYVKGGACCVEIKIKMSFFMTVNISAACEC